MTRPPYDPSTPHGGLDPDPLTLDGWTGEQPPIVAGVPRCQHGAPIWTCSNPWPKRKRRGGPFRRRLDKVLVLAWRAWR